ncbi:ABC transporter permease [Vibrio variabilis]|uniref:ABC transporter permease n=1 Tax=Vibrio variabilis TaxID=990271 RepID=UPI000DDBAD0A|nr:ABC transporter permease [Vibrio variabilis]
MLLLKRNQYIGIGLLSLLFISALTVSWSTPIKGSVQDLSNALAMPSSAHWLGTDQYGRSMVVRLSEAITLSFGLALICMLTSSIIGTGLGTLAAWQGKRLEQLLDVVSNILLAMPALVVVLLLSAIFPGSFVAIYVAIAMVQWIEYYRVVKSRSRIVLASSRVEASKMLGFSNLYVLRRHVWPEIAGTVLTLAAFGGANAVLMMATLGFVYVGLQPPIAELGLMSVELFPYYEQAPWLLIQPLIVISLLVLGFHLIAGETTSETEY